MTSLKTIEKTEFFTLSVGCGGNSKYRNWTRGDVNLDLNLPVVKMGNFVRADAHRLPFREKAFDTLSVSHLVEHLEDPRAFLKECLRVCDGKIKIVVPNYLEWAAYQDRTHKWVFIEGRIVRISGFIRLAASLSIHFRHFRRLLQTFLRKSSSNVSIEIRVDKKTIVRDSERNKRSVPRT